MMKQKINCSIFRGGTSKAIFLREDDLPRDLTSRTQMILSIFGSPDKRQIDGLGGADPLTSKLAIIRKPETLTEKPADIIYTFGQVEIDVPDIDWNSLCGNITAAVGLFAVQEQWLTLQEPITRVQVFNTNLKKMLFAEVPVRCGEALTDGNFSIPGVPGTGAPILIDFSNTAGGTTGSLLPTGNPRDEIHVDGFGKICVSLLDIGNAHVFVNAKDVGLKGTESPSEIDSKKNLLLQLEAIRGAAAKVMGMASSQNSAKSESPATPILGVISKPADYVAELTGAMINNSETDLVSRLQFMQRTHKTHAGTSTACVGVAAQIKGTVVHENCRKNINGNLRIGHPAGVINTESVVESRGKNFLVVRATLGRTARRILDGTVFLKSALRAEECHE